MTTLAAQRLRFPLSVYTASILAAVAWRFILSLVDNEAEALTTESFMRRYIPAIFVMYGIPIVTTILWLTRAVQKRGYSTRKALLWSIPLGCLCGTVFVLLAIGVYYIIWYNVVR
jgi:hypothetical protein